MDDAAALRRCTAAFIVTLTPALRPISEYQYDGTIPFAIAIAYLIVSATVQFDEFTAGREEDQYSTPDDGIDAEQGESPDHDSRDGSNADG